MMQLSRCTQNNRDDDFEAPSGWSDEETDIRVRATALTLFGVLIGGWSFAMLIERPEYFGLLPALFGGWAFGGGLWGGRRPGSPLLMAAAGVLGFVVLGGGFDVSLEGSEALLALGLAAPFVYLASGTAPLARPRIHRGWLVLLCAATMCLSVAEVAARTTRQHNDFHHCQFADQPGNEVTSTVTF
jgi:hypothetical protein